MFEQQPQGDEPAVVVREDVWWGGEVPMGDESGGCGGAEGERGVEVGFPGVGVVRRRFCVCQAGGERRNAEAGMVVDVDVVAGGEAGG